MDAGHLPGRLAIAAVLTAIAVFAWTAVQARPVADVDAARLVNADREPGNWMPHGRTYGEQRFSPLHQINADNAKQLGLAGQSRRRGVAREHLRRHARRAPDCACCRRPNIDQQTSLMPTEY
jgi:glucose dehydrogenase